MWVAEGLSRGDGVPLGHAPEPSRNGTDGSYLIQLADQEEVMDLYVGVVLARIMLSRRSAGRWIPKWSVVDRATMALRRTG